MIEAAGSLPRFAIEHENAPDRDGKAEFEMKGCAPVVGRKREAASRVRSWVKE